MLKIAAFFRRGRPVLNAGGEPRIVKGDGLLDAGQNPCYKLFIVKTITIQ